MTTDHEEARDRARLLGYRAGQAAGSWVVDGNTTPAAAQRLLAGITEGDPEVLDGLPSAPLSGEWAGDPTPDDVRRLAGAEPDDDEVLDAYEEGFSRGVEEAVVAAARAALAA